jgi:hypothetical protein
VHKTLRCRPIDRLLEERAVMAPLPERPPETDRRWVLRVPPDPHLRFDTCDYSLDPRLVGRRVEARVSEREVRAVALDSGELPNSICLQRSSPSWSRNASTVRRSRPAAAHTSRPVVVADDHGQVPLPGSLRDLVDPDALEVGWQVDLTRWLRRRHARRSRRPSTTRSASAPRPRPRSSAPQATPSAPQNERVDREPRLAPAPRR